MTLSVCIIVKDEEAVIGRCLNCASKFADELVVVDTGSTDGTLKEVKKFTDNIYFFKWVDDFSAARNFAFDKAKCDLLMWLDADDVISDENVERIVELKNSFSDYDMAFLPYAAAFDGDTPTYIYYRERIFKRKGNFRFVGEVHEAVEPRGKILYSDAVIFHKKVKENAPLRNLNILQKLIASGKTLSERQKFYYGRELYFNNMFSEAIAVLEKFLEGDGWIVNKCEACVNLFYAYRALGKDGEAYQALLKSLLYAPPNPQVCCIMGEYFMDKDLSAAEFWYKRALEAGNGLGDGSFVNMDFSNFIPHMQLCVIYDRLKDFKRAFEENELAGKIKPENANFLSNKQYFKNLGLRREE